MDTSFEEKIIELEDNNKYYVLKQLIDGENIYLLANVLKDEENPGEEFVILKVINAEKGLRIALEEDEAKLNDLADQFSNLME